MHGIGGSHFSAVHDFFGARHGSEDEGALLCDAAVRVLHGVEHWGEWRGKCHGDLRGVRRPHAPAGRADRRGARILRGADDGDARDQHDAEGDSRRQRVQWKGFFALRRVALVSCRCWYLVTGKVKLMFFFFYRLVISLLVVFVIC